MKFTQWNWRGFFLFCPIFVLFDSRHSTGIGAKPNLYCEAIELVGSPKVCVLVEWKARHRVKSEQWQLKPVWISCLYSTSVQSLMKVMETMGMG